MVRLAWLLKYQLQKNLQFLLIDEIDKADIDFPNDLLNELEWSPRKVIQIPEGETQIEIQYPPIVIITSNDERELPAAFFTTLCFLLYRIS